MNRSVKTGFPPSAPKRTGYKKILILNEFLDKRIFAITILRIYYNFDTKAHAPNLLGAEFIPQNLSVFSV